MKNILLIVLFSTALYSCVEVKFKNAQPIKTKSLAEFPKELQGKYLMFAKDSLNEIDTVEIGKNYFNEGVLVQSDEPKILANQAKKYLSDSLILRQVNNNFTINFKDKDLWTVLLLKPSKEGFAILWIDGDNEDTAEQLNLTTKVKTVKDEDGKIDSYILDPKKKEFFKMIKNKYIFSKLNELKKIQP